MSQEKIHAHKTTNFKEPLKETQDHKVIFSPSIKTVTTLTKHFYKMHTTMCFCEAKGKLNSKIYSITKEISMVQTQELFLKR